jgi:hypothetical protein
VDVVFGRGKPNETHTQQLLDELGESYGHLKLAAGHLAGGAAERFTPRYDKARVVASRGWTSTKGAFAPLYAQMRDGAANARRMEVEVVDKRNRWPMLMGLLATGAAVGAAGALVSRRRRAAQQWDEFEPAPPLDEAGFPITEPSGLGETAGPGKEKGASATQRAAAGAASVAESVAAQADKLADSLHEKASRPSGSGAGTRAGEKVTDTAASAAETASTAEKTASTAEKVEKSAAEKTSTAKSATEKARDKSNSQLP